MATLIFLLLGSVVNSGYLAWQLVEIRRDNRLLRLENERLLARVGHEYGLALGRPLPIPAYPSPTDPSESRSSRPFFSTRKPGSQAPDQSER